MTDLYTVFGNPIHHSLSPEIHSEFARKTGQDLVYTKTLVPLGDFASAVRDFQARGGKGANVTSPFKREAALLCDELREGALRCGCVNTLYFTDNGRIIGDNTDGPGFVRDLAMNKGVHLKDQRILILGAGGAARGLLHAIAACLPKSMVIMNRTPVAVEAILRDFSDISLGMLRYENSHHVQCDVIINATSSSLQNTLPPLSPLCVQRAKVCIDLAYSDEDTTFVAWAKSLGVVAYDGLGMLREQAALSFEWWRGG